MKYSSEDVTSLITEWRQYGISRAVEELNDIVQHWLHVGSLKSTAIGDCNTSQQAYPILTRLSTSVLSIPHGNAAVERAFSCLSDPVTKKRNCLNEISVNSCLVISGYLRASNYCCYNFPLSEDLVQMGFNAHASYQKRLKQEKEADKKKSEQAARKRKLEEEMERSKEQMALLNKQKQIASNKSELQEEESSALLMIAEYQKKLSLIQMKRKKIEKDEKKLTAEQTKSKERIIKKTIEQFAKN